MIKRELVNDSWVTTTTDNGTEWGMKTERKHKQKQQQQQQQQQQRQRKIRCLGSTRKRTLWVHPEV